MLRGKRIFIFSLVIFILMSTFTYLMWGLTNKESTDEIKTEEQKSGVAVELKAKQKNSLSELIKTKEEEFKIKILETEGLLQGELLNDNWNLKSWLILRTHYKKCNHIIVNQKKRINKDFKVNNLSDKYPNWNVVHNDSYRVILQREVVGVCQDDKEDMYLGIKDGVISIFYGTPNKDINILKRKTNIAVGVLPDREIANLKKGIIVKNQKDLLTLLEGFASIQDEKIE
ncbi:BofC C-terminal domain-containing protein [Selenihalanaerobacter shriftii]|uniref:BofC C-terminal domain-containing protein n=1 Tax=Selenihalanaerobacter shriftii TaxID=142842 RepID=A0A1T4MYU2_9FIRM|nr:BofC C-terminal domain-containing protein [Selenihalanaerobacter shriftii]SJZ72014.1 BofC C-terminal domain-containing protein [Selenihalanaerobacter shriftii]